MTKKPCHSFNPSCKLGTGKLHQKIPGTDEQVNVFTSFECP